jgi:GH24 family phage-related lysozyme (muramidase)
VRIERPRTNGNRLAAAAAIATAIAIPAEGLRQYAYYDPPGILTVCYGSTTGVVKGKKYSLEECKARLDSDMMQAIKQVDACVPGLPENVLAAFGDAAYNLGPKIACDTSQSTAARMLKAGDVEGACKQLTRWDKARVGGVAIALPGLTKRRAKETALCLGK